MEDKKVFDGNISMLRLSEKRNLLEDCAVIFLGLSKYREVLPKKFRKKTTRSVMADFKVKTLRKYYVDEDIDGK